MPSRRLAVISGDDDEAHGASLHRIRNMWQFANVCQWIYIFGKAAKIEDSVDIEELETECLKPQSQIFADITLNLLKLVSSQRGLTLETLDNQLRKEYATRYSQANPLGDDNDKVSFADLDVFTKIKILQQLTQWTMVHPERLRERMEEQKDVEQTSWRIEPYGWDREDRTYFVLDDNRIYRLTEPPNPVPQSTQKRSKKHLGRRRTHNRSRVGPTGRAPTEDTADTTDAANGADEGLGGAAWECIAVTLSEALAFLNTLTKTHDANEKTLRKQLEQHLIPLLVKQEESMQRKQLQRERELLNLSRMANAKRSSRIADKLEKQKLEEEESEQRRRELEAEKTKQREEAAQIKAEQERDFRTFARQRRLKEREARRVQHEEEIAQLSEEGRNPVDTSRFSERQLQAEIDRKRKVLQNIESEEEGWIFDCICGLHGQVDDGGHAVACERCNVWQHSNCVGIQEDEAEQPEFHFICLSCTRRQKVS